MAETRQVADEVNALGAFDAVIHNAGIGYREPLRIATADGLPHVFAVNTMAPYLLTALIRRPKRLVYLTSGLHRQGDPSLHDLHDVLLAFAVARRWPGVFSNSVEPGWVATKMGGDGAPDDLGQGFRTQAWLAVSDDPAAQVSGENFYHLKLKTPLAATQDTGKQNKLLEACEQLSGVKLPAA
jgi:NAD(P)-dependent dehydrogenase (short-subunit alcohol dehydrogenase family)